jgi:hypothetical protein
MRASHAIPLLRMTDVASTFMYRHGGCCLPWHALAATNDARVAVSLQITTKLQLSRGAEEVIPARLTGKAIV